MKFLLSSAVAVFSAVVAMAAPAETSDAFTLHHFSKRNEAAPYKGAKSAKQHMVSLRLGKSLFSTLDGVTKVLIPAQVQALTIPDIVGQLPGLGFTGATDYNMHNIRFQNVTVGEKNQFVLKDGYAKFGIDISGVFAADYTTKGRVGFSTKTSSGSLSIDLKKGRVDGTLFMTNNGVGGLQISMRNVTSNIDQFNIAIKDSWWLKWMTNFVSIIAKPVIASALGTVVSTAVPPLVNLIFQNHLTLGLRMPNGRSLGFEVKMAGDPIINPEEVKFDLDLISDKASQY